MKFEIVLDCCIMPSQSPTRAIQMLLKIDLNSSLGKLVAGGEKAD
jgi:hypothetical protein